MSNLNLLNGGYITRNKPVLTRTRGNPVNYTIDYSPGYSSGNLVDRSSNNISTTNNGVVYNSATPFSGTNYGNIYFDNSGDFFSANSSAFTFGTGDFTVECWIYIISRGTYSCIIEANPGGGGRTNSFVFLANSSGKLQIFAAGDFRFTGPTTVPLNQWNHVALVRSSGITSCYLNGVYETQTNYSMNVTTNYCQAGRIGDNASGFTGYIANYKVIKGSAAYLSNFTPDSTAEQLTTLSLTPKVSTSTYGIYVL